MANNIDQTVQSLLKGMEGYLSSKTIVGEPIEIKGTIILPLAEVSFGAGAGAFDGEKKENCGGGIGGKVTPSALLVIQNGSAKLVSVKDSDIFSKLIDMVPDLINKIAGKKNEAEDFDDVDFED
ncbi:MAG: sporulation protein [Lachnospiraceae bacterium]|nr:sporulation protein [Lachnospiraceae bacterium]MCR5082435.1 GerW family sporulation protein [Parasporobacterium sp.]